MVIGIFTPRQARNAAWLINQAGINTQTEKSLMDHSDEVKTQEKPEGEAPSTKIKSAEHTKLAAHAHMTAVCTTDWPGERVTKRWLLLAFTPEREREFQARACDALLTRGQRAYARR
jgi:hypothetical protein